jgi:hypothetical protein
MIFRVNQREIMPVSLGICNKPKRSNDMFFLYADVEEIEIGAIEVQMVIDIRIGLSAGDYNAFLCHTWQHDEAKNHNYFSKVTLSFETQWSKTADASKATKDHFIGLQNRTKNRDHSIHIRMYRTQEKN